MTKRSYTNILVKSCYGGNTKMVKILVNKDVVKKLDGIKKKMHCSDSTAILIMFELVQAQFRKKRF